MKDNEKRIRGINDFSASQKETLAALGGNICSVLNYMVANKIRMIVGNIASVLYVLVGNYIADAELTEDESCYNEDGEHKLDAYAREQDRRSHSLRAC